MYEDDDSPTTGEALNDVISQNLGYNTVEFQKRNKAAQQEGKRPANGWDAEHKAEADRMFPEGCKCGNNGGGDCDWCVVYYDPNPIEHKQAQTAGPQPQHWPGNPLCPCAWCRDLVAQDQWLRDNLMAPDADRIAGERLQVQTQMAEEDKAEYEEWSDSVNAARPTPEELDAVEEALEWADRQESGEPDADELEEIYAAEQLERAQREQDERITDQ